MALPRGTIKPFAEQPHLPTAMKRSAPRSKTSPTFASSTSVTPKAQNSISATIAPFLADISAVVPSVAALITLKA